jgi:hypothetical protein
MNTDRIILGAIQMTGEITSPLCTKAINEVISDLQFAQFEEEIFSESLEKCLYHHCWVEISDDCGFEVDKIPNCIKVVKLTPVTPENLPLNVLFLPKLKPNKVLDNEDTYYSGTVSTNGISKDTILVGTMYNWASFLSKMYRKWAFDYVRGAKKTKELVELSEQIIQRNVFFFRSCGKDSLSNVSVYYFN